MGYIVLILERLGLWHCLAPGDALRIGVNIDSDFWCIHFPTPLVTYRELPYDYAWIFITTFRHLWITVGHSGRGWWGRFGECGYTINSILFTHERKPIDG
jgi:hypothetical protein